MSKKKLLEELKIIKRKCITDRTVEEELKLAKAEKRQPKCPFCKEELEVQQYQSVALLWSWDKKSKKYIKSEGGDADRPFCTSCEVSDWDFVDFDVIDY